MSSPGAGIAPGIGILSSGVGIAPGAGTGPVGAGVRTSAWLPLETQ